MQLICLSNIYVLCLNTHSLTSSAFHGRISRHPSFRKLQYTSNFWISLLMLASLWIFMLNWWYKNNNSLAIIAFVHLYMFLCTNMKNKHAISSHLHYITSDILWFIRTETLIFHRKHYIFIAFLLFKIKMPYSFFVSIICISTPLYLSMYIFFIYGVRQGKSLSTFLFSQYINV